MIYPWFKYFLAKSPIRATNIWLEHFNCRYLKLSMSVACDDELRKEVKWTYLKLTYSSLSWNETHYSKIRSNWRTRQKGRSSPPMTRSAQRNDGPNQSKVQSMDNVSLDSHDKKDSAIDVIFVSRFAQLLRRKFK